MSHQYTICPNCYRPTSSVDEEGKVYVYPVIMQSAMSPTGPMEEIKQLKGAVEQRDLELIKITLEKLDGRTLITKMAEELVQVIHVLGLMKDRGYPQPGLVQRISLLLLEAEKLEK